MNSKLSTGNCMQLFSIRRCMSVVTALSVIFHPCLLAQSVVAAQDGAKSATTSSVQTPVTVNFQDVRLDYALRTVAQEAGIELAYTPNIFPVSRRVTLRTESIPARTVLEKLVAGTGFHVQVWSDKKIALVRNDRPRGFKAQGVVMGRVTDAKTGN